jgi:hypothetical protein
MIRTDERSHLVAIIPDCVMNPRSPRYQSLGIDLGGYYESIENAGYGIMATPSHLADRATVADHVALTVRDAVNYLQNGYEVAIVGVEGVDGGAVWLPLLEAGFARWKRDLPAVYSIGSAAALPEFLNSNKEVTA